MNRETTIRWLKEKPKHLHFLHRLKDCSCVYQKEIRNALDYAIEIIENQE